MAYEVKKPKQQENEQENPYDALAGGGYQAPTSSMLPMNLTADTPWRPEGGGSSATGYVNFDRLYGANADVSTREARSRTDAAEKKAKAAQQGLSGANREFESKLSGATQTGPTSAQQDWAKYGQTGVEQPKQVRGAHYTPTGQTNVFGPGKGAPTSLGLNIPEVAGAVASSNAPAVQQVATHKEEDVRGQNADQTNHVTQSGDGLDSGGYTRNSGPDIDPEDFELDDQALLGDAVRKGAGKVFDGPMGLSELEQYQKLLDDTTAAQDLALNPITGLGETDSALLGAAGRPAIERLKKQYGGLSDTLNKVNEATSKKAQAAKKQTEDAAAAYQGLLDEYEGRVSADKDKAETAQTKSDDALAAARKEAEDKKKFNDFLNNRSAVDTVRNTLHGVATAMNPIDLALEGMGEQGVTPRLTNAISAPGPDNKGNASPVWTDDDYDVFSSMSQSDWDEFNALPPEKQRAWLDARKAKLRGGK